MEVLDYHKLKIFKAVADLKSFSKAAEMLFLAQPTVTLQIKKIENYLGITLFQRKKNEIVLTREGEIFYQYASKILDDYTVMEAELSKLKEDIEKNLTIGASSTIGEYLLPKVLPEFLDKYPFAKINLFIGNSKEIEEGILSKSFNIGLIEDKIKSNKINLKELYADEIIPVTSYKNKIPPVIKKEEIEKYKFIFREVGSGTRNILENQLKNLGMLEKMNIVMEVSSSTAIFHILENSNEYIAFISKLIAERGIQEKLLKEVKIEGLNLERYFSLITQKNIRFSNLENRFVSFLKEKLSKTL